MKEFEIREQNRRAWNEVAPRHAMLLLDDIRANLLRGNGHYIHPTLQEELKTICLRGKTTVQFNCNNARELISIMQLGAERGIGVDFSKEFISQARELVKTCGVDVALVESDIFQLGHEYDNLADVLLITSGALCWMEDLETYFEIVARVLKQNGTLIIHETHPFLEMFKLDRQAKKGETLVPAYSYFMKNPIISSDGLDYYGNTKFGHEITYWYHHNFSTIFSAILASGFRLSAFRELADDLDSGYARVKDFDIKLPMSYVLTAHKESISHASAGGRLHE